MAIRLITGRLQQGSRYCARKQHILQKTPCGIFLSHVVATINCNVYRMEFSVKIVGVSHSIYSFAVNGR